MSATARVLHLLNRPLTSGEQRAVRIPVGLLLLITASVLVLTKPTSPAAVIADRGAPHHAQGGSLSSSTSGLSPAAKATVQTFLAGYLKYLYGRAPARAVKDTTGSFAYSLEQHPPLVPEGLKRLKPQVLRVLAAPAPPGFQRASAIVSDTEILTYRITLLLKTVRGHELIDGLDPR
jgi:hypothetical protein